MDVIHLFSPPPPRFSAGGLSSRGLSSSGSPDLLASGYALGISAMPGAWLFLLVSGHLRGLTGRAALALYERIIWPK